MSSRFHAVPETYLRNLQYHYYPLPDAGRPRLAGLRRFLTDLGAELWAAWADNAELIHRSRGRWPLFLF